MKSNDPKFSAACKQYCQGMKDGKGSKVLLKATGLSHSQADRAWYASELNPNRVISQATEFAAMTEEQKNAFVISMRIAKASWGKISLTTGESESATQTRFSRSSGIAAEGLRVGKGGRFLEDEPRRYLGNRKGLGIEDAKPRMVKPEEAMKDADKVKSVLPTKLRSVAKRAAVSVKADVEVTA